jgi:UDP-3-O-acyl-N-acetylglucosamine deacetylase
MKLPSQILYGDGELLQQSFTKMQAQPVDWDLRDHPVPPLRTRQTTIASSTSISGPGTFMGKATRTISFEPTDQNGWWFDRTDLPGSLPIKVGIANVWTTGQIVSNIVLRSGNPHNYVRMVEHLISLRMGMGIDNLIIKIDSGDPPLFERGSLDVVEALEQCGTRELDHPVQYVTVKEPVAVGGPNGEFVALYPPEDTRSPKLEIDCAIHFPTAIGQQRIIFPVTKDLVKYASVARTNTSFSKMLYCKTIGKLFADIRNLGYNTKNVSIAGKKRYINPPRLEHEGKALEAVWHRAVLDLLAAIALIPEGLFVGKILSYKAGHRLDCELIRQLYLNQMLTPFDPS